jgi:phage tail sheath protein FI
MPLNLASPGIVVREVDLTVGRVNTVSDSVAALVAPFAKGPVDSPAVIENENDLLNTFGQPYSTDKHYEHWMVASSYLAYGGKMLISRADDADIKNAFVGTASSIKIKSEEHYNQLGYDENVITNVTVAAKNPGSWANDVKVAIIDAKADQTLGINTVSLVVGYGITQAVPANTVLSGAGGTSILDGYFKGIITGVGVSSIDVKVLSRVSAAGTEYVVDYEPGGNFTFGTTGNITVRNSSLASITNTIVFSSLDWFDQQKIELSNGSISWNTIANRPSTSAYADSRSSRFDELHVVVIDDKGTVTGNAGTILEKHLSLSKATDASYSVGSPSYWRKYLQANSSYIYGGSAPVGITTTGFTSAFTLATDVGWDQETQGITFACSGNSTSTLAGGKNYDGGTDLTTSGALYSGLSNIISGYTIFENSERYATNFILMGSANYSISDARAIAQKCIQVAELRKDSVAFISPYRQAFITDTSVGSVTVNSDDTITDNVLSFYAPVASSTYAIFDSGYKYMYDRFNDTFRYVPLNGDIAGTCARNDINQFPWFSPAGTSRGTILNAVKLAYNPGKVQRDKLYSARINPVIFSPGAGIILFGDKTGYGKSSAFDRINVRRLFIYLEKAISAAAKDQLFEFNDEITRTNFVNIVEPFLRDVQSKRGVYDYVVVCDETNNTAAVIDSNEFVADIYIKPARSINFIGLTFIATRTGVSFEEVIGNV